VSGSTSAAAAASYDVLSACLVLFFLTDPAAALRTQRAMWEAVPPQAPADVERAAADLLAGWDGPTFTQQVRHTLGRRRPAP